MPLVLVLAVATIELGMVVLQRVASGRYGVVNLALIGAGLIFLAVVAVLAYRQGIVADETAGAAASSAPLVLAALASLAVIALGLAVNPGRAS